MSSPDASHGTSAASASKQVCPGCGPAKPVALLYHDIRVIASNSCMEHACRRQDVSDEIMGQRLAAAEHLDGVKGGLLSRSGRSGGALFRRSLFLSLNLPIHVPHKLCQDDIQVLLIPQPARSDSILARYTRCCA
jgi:hypothetical protein